MEQKNLEAGHQFKEVLTGGLEDVSSAIETFRVDHSGFCGRQRLAFGEYSKSIPCI